MTKLKEIDFSDKYIASLDVEALFTNVQVDKSILVIRDLVEKLDDEMFPVPKKDYLDLITLCMNFQCFMFNSEEYTQTSGLAMGSPLSPVAACLYMESLEKTYYINIMPPGSSWFRYVDDILLIVPQSLCLDKKIKELNLVDNKIHLTVEREKNGCLPFLDMEIIRKENEVRFKVYRKRTHRNDYIHFFSGHSMTIKRGVIIGFFLRAFRICSQEFLENELNFIYQSFTSLKYPKGLLCELKNKALKIRERKPIWKKPKEEYFSIPNSAAAEFLAKGFKKHNVNLVIRTGEKTGEILKHKNDYFKEQNNIVYKIPCSSCNKCYIGETSRGASIRIQEHKRDIRNHVNTNAFVDHINNSSHLPDFSNAYVVAKCKSKKQRKTLESAYIQLNNTINIRAGFIKLSHIASKMCVCNSKIT